MKQVLVKDGRTKVDEVPAPCIEPGTVLVRVTHSCISSGTELSGVAASGRPLWKRVLEQPEKLEKVWKLVSERGLMNAYEQVKGKLGSALSTGYSAAGIVCEVGAEIDDFAVGDRVACAGAQCAFHAGVIRVPRNLAVPVPDRVELGHASTVALGAIALQGVRRAKVVLGESCVVLGLGLLGNLTCQILTAAGCRVIGIEPDVGRREFAARMGIRALDPQDGRLPEQVARATDGVGADAVIITASTASHDAVAEAFRMSRKKGRVVLVGDVGLHLNREDVYEKELDFLISTSYGPGRYDRLYEERGVEYPLAYVRWTETRNMTEYLRLIEETRVNVAPLIGASFPIEQAATAYETLAGKQSASPAVLLTYSEGPQELADRVVTIRPRQSGDRRGIVRLAVVGAGGFAQAVHFPNLKALHPLVELAAIVDRTGHKATAVGQQYQAGYVTTEYGRVLEDASIDAVLIATRHHLHASMALQALQAGKHVYLEKPLALTADELERLAAFFSNGQEGETPVLMTGFNRRFSPHAVRLCEVMKAGAYPVFLTYRVNAGWLPPDHWTRSPEGGGRNLGEACHMYDFVTAVTGAKVERISVSGMGRSTGHFQCADNFSVTMTLNDGSVATITYTAMGASECGKERIEVFADGKVGILDDFKTVTFAGVNGRDLATRTTEKGHREALRAFAKTVLEGGSWPVPLWQQIQATRIALDVETKLRRAD